MLDRQVTLGSFAALVGYELTHWQAGQATVRLAIEARHMNRSGVLHGGVLTTLIDTACGYAGCHGPAPAPPRRAMTLSLHTQFIAAVEAGAHLEARARHTGGGRRIFFSDCEVVDQTGRLVARGEGTFRYRGP